MLSFCSLLSLFWIVGFMFAFYHFFVCLFLAAMGESVMLPMSVAIFAEARR